MNSQKIHEAMKCARESDKPIRWSPLDVWIEDMKLEDFVDRDLHTHLEVYGIEQDKIEDLKMFIMNSLRRAIGER
jgi:hypothetical protein